MAHPSKFNYTTSVNGDERMSELNPALTKKAHYWASRTGENADDLKSDMILAILERASADPHFLSESPAYIINFGEWRMLRKVQRAWRHGEYMPLDDLAEVVGKPDDGDTSGDYKHILESLSGEHVALVQEIIKAGDDVLRKNGSLNISALSARLGKPERTVNRQVKHMRCLLKTAPALAA